MFRILCGIDGNLSGSRGERRERASAASERAERLTAWEIERRAGRVLCINALLDAATVAAITVEIVVADVAVTIAAAAALAVAVAGANVAIPGNPDELDGNIGECCNSLNTRASRSFAETGFESEPQLH